MKILAGVAGDVVSRCPFSLDAFAPGQNSISAVIQGGPKFVTPTLQLIAASSVM